MLLDAEGADGLAGTVVKAAYLGKHLEYTVDSPIGELFAIDRRVEAPRATGSGVTIRFGDRIALVPAERYGRHPIGSFPQPRDRERVAFGSAPL